MELVTVIDGEPTTDSGIIADAVGNPHRGVIQLVRTHQSDLEEFGGVQFEMRPFETAGGSQNRTVAVLNEPQATLLMTYLRNSEAVRTFKKTLVSAFYQMRQKLTQPTSIDVRDPGQLAAIAIQLIEVNKELEGRAVNAEAQVEAAKPKTAFYDNFANAEGLYGLQNAARVLGQPPNKFVGWLKQTYLFYQGGALVPRADYKTMGLFEVKATIIDEKSRYRTWVTPKGIQYLAKKLEIPQPGLLPIPSK